MIVSQPGKIYMISDTHFGDSAILRYENRPFENVAKMNEAMVENWNKTVKENDTVYHLGDVGTDESMQEIIPKLNGRKILIKGNHDEYDNAYYREVGFDDVYEHPVIIRGFLILSHEPVYVSTNMPYANIFGHVHGSVQYQIRGPRCRCVCAEHIRYVPVWIEDILASMRGDSYFIKDEDDFISSQIENGADEAVITFIRDVLMSGGRDTSECIRKLFRAGYCYYFAHMLKQAFGRGEVCVAAPFGHFIWVDDDKTPYDIEGIYCGEAEEFVPERYMGDAVNDFKHVKGLAHNTTEEEIKAMMARCREDRDRKQVYKVTHRRGWEIRYEDTETYGDGCLYDFAKEEYANEACRRLNEGTLTLEEIYHMANHGCGSLTDLLKDGGTGK